MAGGFGQKSNPKQIKSLSSEVINNFPSNSPQSNENDSGILNPGQSVEFNKEQPKQNWNQEFLSDSLETSQKLIIQRQGKETNQKIEDIRSEIITLIATSEEKPKQEIIKTPLINIPEKNQYQLNFLERIKKSIKQDISESNIWLDTFNQKRSKQRSFWGRAKKGGQKYLFSGEHNASRSAN